MNDEELQNKLRLLDVVIVSTIKVLNDAQRVDVKIAVLADIDEHLRNLRARLEPLQPKQTGSVISTENSNAKEIKILREKISFYERERSNFDRSVDKA